MKLSCGLNGHLLGVLRLWWQRHLERDWLGQKCRIIYVYCLFDLLLRYVYPSFSGRGRSACLYVCMSVCLFVCLSARVSQKKHISKFHAILYTFTCGRGSVCLCRQCDMLCLPLVLWMKSYIHVSEQMGRIRDTVYVSSSSRDGGTGSKSDLRLHLVVGLRKTTYYMEMSIRQRRHHSKHFISLCSRTECS